MQDRSVIVADIRSAIAEIAEVEVGTVEPETDLIRDLEIDSLMSIELLFMLEQRFGIVIPQEVIPTLVTVNGIADAVTSRLGLDQ